MSDDKHTEEVAGLQLSDDDIEGVVGGGEVVGTQSVIPTGPTPTGEVRYS